MTNPPFANAEALRIGTVDHVSPNEIKAVLDVDAPESVAIMASGPRPFPRINGYLLIPVDDGFIVGQIEWLTVERSSFPKRKGVQDFGVVDLPYPMRKLSLAPLGTLRKKNELKEGYNFQRGADALPGIGGAVLLPTEVQLRSIVESGERRRVRIGTSPLAGGATVSVDPDRLFGRHLAVLGNTGGGKSCTVAGLIRWSIEAARKCRTYGGKANARFVILDPNGEYSRAFSGEDNNINARIFRVNPEENEGLLQVPLWFWNSSEWSSFTQATARTQRPLLKRALRDIKAGRSNDDADSPEQERLRLRRYLSFTVVNLRRDIRSGALKNDKQLGWRLTATMRDLTQKAEVIQDVQLGQVVQHLTTAIRTTYQTFNEQGTGRKVEYFTAFSEDLVTPIVSALEISLQHLGGIVPHDGPDEDVPLPFAGADLADHIEMLAEQENSSQFVEFFVSRLRTILSDKRINAVVGDSTQVTLEEWLKLIMGDGGESDSEVAILDLSLVPSDVVQVLTAVTARMIFESLQRYRRQHGTALPTVLVMEEAHTFVKRYRDDSDDFDSASICCQVFERISREGRKFGLGLVVSSQRPSELSPTVLSQCNTFLLHRISNDRDQERVQRLVPDNLRGLLRELPSLPSRYALLLGWASELPILVKIDELPEAHRPHSADPDFWNVWSGLDEEGRPVERAVDWKQIADLWQLRTAEDSGEDDGDSEEDEWGLD